MYNPPIDLPSPTIYKLLRHMKEEDIHELDICIVLRLSNRDALFKKALGHFFSSGTEPLHIAVRRFTEGEKSIQWEADKASHWMADNPQSQTCEKHTKQARTQMNTNLSQDVDKFQPNF